MPDVLHCITTIDIGGAEKQLYILAKEQKQMGLNVSVIYLKGKAELLDLFQEQGIQVLSFVANKNPLVQIIKLKKYLNSYRGILHAHLPRAELLSAISLGSSTFIISKHNSESFLPSGPKRLSKLLARFVLNKSDYCIAISNSVSNYLMNLGELVKSDKFSIVYYGIPNDTSKGGIEKCLKNQDLEILKIGTIGRIVEQKDYPTLIRAFSFYKTMSNSSELLVVGDGVLKKKMVAFSKELKVDSSITWLGRLSDVKLMLNNLDIFVLASRYEGFGLVLLEAMQSKTPIIAANNSAISEVLGLNYPGLFETGNSLDLYSKLVSCQSSSFRNLLLSFAGNRLNLFDSKKMCSEVVKIYDVAVCNFTKIK